MQLFSSNDRVKTVRKALLPFVAVTLLFGPAAAAGQNADVAAQVRAALDTGDRAYVAMHATEALAHYERAVELDSTSYEGSWKASRSAADLEQQARGDAARHGDLLHRALLHARRAVMLRPGEAEAHFSLARTLGLTARTASPRKGVKQASAVRSHALRCLEIDPHHAGCLHVMGAWNAGIMGLNGFTRLIARTVLGGRTLGRASWADAEKYLEAAAREEPARIIHHLELGQLYQGRNRRPEARREFEAVLQLETRDYNDSRYKAEARVELQRVGQ